MTLADGTTTTATRSYLEDSIRSPEAMVVKGFPPIMPTVDIGPYPSDHRLHPIVGLGGEMRTAHSLHWRSSWSSWYRVRQRPLAHTPRSKSTSPGTDSVLGAAPTEIGLNFSEACRAVERGVRAFNSAGERTDSESFARRGALRWCSELSQTCLVAPRRCRGESRDDGHTISDLGCSTSAPRPAPVTSWMSRMT